MEELSEEFASNAQFLKVDVDKNFELAAKYGVMSIPFVAVFKGGELADKTVGFSSKSEMREFLQTSLK